MKTFPFLVILLISCAAPKTDPDKIRREILELEAAQRTFHFDKNAKAFVGLFSDDFLSISKGKIDRPDSIKSLERFSRYFDAVEFIAWDDVNPPLVRMSEDGSMAFSVLDKQVILSYLDEAGETRIDTTHFAWTTLYRRENGIWKIDAVTSTNQ